MSEHRATIEWKLEGEFRYEVYPRSHTIDFGRGIRVPGSAAPENVPTTAAGAPGVDPEQAFVASLSSCHMLWFLHVACRAKFIVERYLDEAAGTLEKDAAGKMAMTRVILRPLVTFSGAAPAPEQHARLHESAHEKCYIANSVKTEVVVQPSIA